jgi:microcystin degradation protein MlrC
MPRIAVGGFQHETNTFAPQRATWDDFARPDAWPGYIRGPELFDAVEGFNIPIAGAVKTLTGLGYELAPLSWCSAPPSSYVDEEAYEKVAAAILEDLAAAGPLDGIFLDLHGAMVAAHHEDGEGELLRRVRALVGDTLPIVTSLDFHTNMTREMVRHASAMVGYKTYPHIDMSCSTS